MRRLVILAWMMALGACASPAPDTVLLNGRVFTADPGQPWVEAIAIRGGRVVARGDSATIGALAGPTTIRRDIGGRTVIPGLTDAHVDSLEPGAAPLRARARTAVAWGVTSQHLFSMTRAVSETVRDLIDADTPLRYRVFRAPRPGAAGETLDSRPNLPPQPTLRIDVRGMAFVLHGADRERIRQVVGWAYGSEDPLSIEPGDADALVQYMDAIEDVGIAEVWERKRPRVERVGRLGNDLAARLAAAGMVAVQRPDESGSTLPLASLVRAGIPLALAAGGGTSPFVVLDWAVSPERGAEALTAEQAVTAFTRGSAYAGFGDGDRGHLSVGAFADLAVLSDDIFTAPRERWPGIHSVLTMIGGRPVHDVP